MNWDQISGGWKQFKGKAKEKWGKLTDDDLDILEGKRDQLIGNPTTLRYRKGSGGETSRRLGKEVLVPPSDATLLELRRGDCEYPESRLIFAPPP